MQTDAVILETKSRFPALAEVEVHVAPIEKGGSGRKFYRIQSGRSESMIVVKYTPQRPENLRYVEIAEMLAGAGVPVPAIYFHDKNEGLIWMQDLGELDLWAMRNAPCEERRSAYRLAMGAVATLHVEATRAFEASPLSLEMEFDEQLYLWEQGYFFEHCLGGIFGMERSQVERYASLPALGEMAGTLAGESRTLVHRDFQSQNVMLSNGIAWLIDFQGMRPGLPHYDLASLLYDPYVDLDAADREVLLGDYKAMIRARGGEIGEQFDFIFARCAMQRLMQALGAYGFLGLKCGRSEFLMHVPSARKSLREVAAQVDGMDEFVSLLEKLP